MKDKELKDAIDRIKPDTAKNYNTLKDIAVLLDFNLQKNLRNGKDYACYKVDELKAMVATIHEVRKEMILHIAYLQEATKYTNNELLTHSQQQHYTALIKRNDELEKIAGLRQNNHG